MEALPLFQVAEIAISYKSKVKMTERPTIRDSRTAYELLRQYWDEDLIDLLEQGVVLYLNKANKVLALFKLSIGGLDSVVIDKRLVFATALKLKASAFILAHNHPSGSLLPSHQDKCITVQLKEAGKILQINLNDHLILTSDSYYSMADNGDL